MSIDYRTIGKRIKEKRKLCSMTQERLAEELGVSVGYVSQIERGITRVNLDTLSNISAILDCEITELLTNVDGRRDGFLSVELSEIFNSLNERQRKMLLEIAEIVKNN